MSKKTELFLYRCAKTGRIVTKAYADANPDTTIRETVEMEVGIFKEIEEERARQDAKFGLQRHEPIIWMPILMEEVGEASKDALDAHFDNDKTKLVDYRKELIQVAAVAVAMIQSLEATHGI